VLQLAEDRDLTDSRAGDTFVLVLEADLLLPIESAKKKKKIEKKDLLESNQTVRSFVLGLEHNAVRAFADLANSVVGVERVNCCSLGHPCFV